MESTPDLEQFVDTFYAALNQVYAGDASAMIALWANAPYVSAMHSLADAEVGNAQVQATWQTVSSRVHGGQVTFEPLVVQVAGNTGLAIGRELGSVTVDGKTLEVNLRVTNVFEHTGGQWKVIHHHADTVVAIEDAVD